MSDYKKENVTLLKGNIEEPYGLVDPQDTSTGNIIFLERVKKRAKLFERLNKMSSNDRRMLLKIVQYDLIMETLSAVENLKNTKESTWKRIIGKLIAIKDVNIGVDPSGFNFKNLLTILIPLLGLLAGILLALRQADEAEIEASAPDENDSGAQEILKLKSMAENQANKIQSIILEYCNGNTNGYSYTR